MRLRNNIDKIRLSFYKDKEPYLNLYNIMGFYPHRLKLYQTALRHRSCHDAGRGNVNNERLEFLGDAVLGAVVADILYKKYTKRQEGFLTTLRSKLVCRETLNQLAVTIGLDKLVLHSNNLQLTRHSSLNGNAFEAFIGAIYLDRGYRFCYQFMEEVIFAKYLDIEKISSTDANFKSKLIEWCQKHQLKIVFEVKETKEDNASKFFSEVFIEGVFCGKGVGYSKKDSHQGAAHSALKKVQGDVGFVNKLFDARTANKKAKEQNDISQEQKQE